MKTVEEYMRTWELGSDMNRVPTVENIKLIQLEAIRHGMTMAVDIVKEIRFTSPRPHYKDAERAIIAARDNLTTPNAGQNGR